MLLAATTFIYLEWREASEILQVSVIDSRTGNTKTYRVSRGNLEERTFQTLDGKIVRLAETDRLEVLSEE